VVVAALVLVVAAITVGTSAAGRAGRIEVEPDSDHPDREADRRGAEGRR
jgi:hypothetical protein